MTLKVMTMTVMTLSCVGYHIMADMRSSIWHIQTDKTLSNFDLMTPASSQMTCLQECMTQTRCETCGYDALSGQCYLQLFTSTVGGSTVHGVTLFTDSCGVSQAPNITANNMVTTWQRTQNGMEGSVECTTPADMLYTGHNPAFSCSGAGQWKVQPGACRQHVWRNDSAVSGAMFYLPSAPTTGWTVCVAGTPNVDTRFFVDVHDWDGNILVHADFRMTFYDHINVLIVTSLINGTWAKSAMQVPFDSDVVAQGLPFRMKLVATNMTSLQVFLDDQLYLTYQTPIALNQAAAVFLSVFIDLHMLDVWCQK